LLNYQGKQSLTNYFSALGHTKSCSENAHCPNSGSPDH